MTKYSLEKREEWKNKIQEQQLSGKTIKQWCKENAISRTRFTYWKAKCFQRAIKYSGFTEIINKATGIVIEHNDITLRLESFDLNTLKDCLALLRGAK